MGHGPAGACMGVRGDYSPAPLPPLKGHRTPCEPAIGRGSGSKLEGRMCCRRWVTPVRSLFSQLARCWAPGLSALGTCAWPPTLVLPGLPAHTPHRGWARFAGCRDCSVWRGRQPRWRQRAAGSPEAITVVQVEGAGNLELGGGHGRRKADELELYLGDEISIHQGWEREGRASDLALRVQLAQLGSALLEGEEARCAGEARGGGSRSQGKDVHGIGMTGWLQGVPRCCAGR